MGNSLKRVAKSNKDKLNTLQEHQNTNTAPIFRKMEPACFQQEATPCPQTKIAQLSEVHNISSETATCADLTVGYDQSVNNSDEQNYILLVLLTIIQTHLPVQSLKLETKQMMKILQT